MASCCLVFCGKRVSWGVIQKAGPPLCFSQSTGNLRAVPEFGRDLPTSIGKKFAGEKCFIPCLAAELTTLSQPAFSALKSSQTWSRWILYPQRLPLVAGRPTSLIGSTMAIENPQQEPVYGYLSTLETPDHGFFGGYLLVSPLGRPLEFHCTAPVQPSRAQQILYGPTLQPYLLGEQIGGTLLTQAKLRPNLVLTDQLAAVCLRSQRDAPMVWLLETAGGGEELASEANVQPGLLSDCRFTVGGCRWELPHGFGADREAVMDLLTRLAKHVDLAEPFGRIHEAIHEAQRIGQRGQDAYGEAA